MKIKNRGIYGAKFGYKPMIRYLSVVNNYRKYFKCFCCKSISLKRVSTAIWACKKCAIKVVGAAYEL